MKSERDSPFFPAAASMRRSTRSGREMFRRSVLPERDGRSDHGFGFPGMGTHSRGLSGQGCLG